MTNYIGGVPSIPRSLQCHFGINLPTLRFFRKDDFQSATTSPVIILFLPNVLQIFHVTVHTNVTVGNDKFEIGFNCNIVANGKMKNCM